MDTTLHAGCARCDVTPDWPVVLQGYGARNRLSNGVDDPITVGCIALSSQDTTVLIMTYDMIGMQIEAAKSISAQLADTLGLDPASILLSCSHSHFAPAISSTVLTDPRYGIVDPDPKFVSLIKDKSLAAAEKALADLQQATMKSGKIAVPQVSFNRRTIRADGGVETNFLYPPRSAGLTVAANDDELTVMKLERSQGSDIYLLNYGCHPVTGGVDRERDFYHISSDYIHHLRTEMECRSDSRVFFTLGAAGDSVPMIRGGIARSLIGRSLTDAALLLEPAMRAESAAVGLAAAAERLDTDVIPDPREGIYALMEAHQKKALDTDATDDDVATYEDLLHKAFRQRLYPGGTCTLDIRFLRIGSQVFVALPFEVFSSTSLRIKKKYPDVTLVSCANGYEGYLPSVFDIHRGGYEVEERSMHFAPGTEERISALIEKRLVDF